MADKYVSIDTLGERSVKRIKTVRVTNEETGMGHLEDKMVEERELQGVLSDGEAMVLKDAEWKETRGCNTQSGKYYCVVAGRRFFANINPAEGIDPPADVPSPVGYASLADRTNAELISFAKELIMVKFPTQNDEAREYFKEHGLGKMNLKLNNKAKLLEIISHFEELNA